MAQTNKGRPCYSNATQLKGRIALWLSARTSFFDIESRGFWKEPPCLTHVSPSNPQVTAN